MQAITAKENLKQLIKTIPDESTFEDIQYQLFIVEKLARSREQIRNGKTHTQSEVEKRLKKWIIK
ncbi:MAG: hypothetical protein ACYC4Q_08940 [Victivallaceae bacterium]